MFLSAFFHNALCRVHYKISIWNVIGRMKTKKEERMKIILRALTPSSTFLLMKQWLYYIVQRNYWSYYKLIKEKENLLLEIYFTVRKVWKSDFCCTCVKPINACSLVNYEISSRHFFINCTRLKARAINEKMTRRNLIMHSRPCVN